MSSKCLVKFDHNPLGIYESGELLTGAVEITTVKLKVIRAIHVTINGYAKVRWKQHTANRRRRQKAPDVITYCSNQQYLSSKTYVVGEEGGDPFDLPPGSYLYKFQMLLPPDLPSSFEGQYGHIRYEVIVRIDRPTKFDNIFKQPFTIITPLNLNCNPAYKRPTERSVEKTFWCGLCCSKTLTAKVHIPMSGYAPGQDINFVLSIDNVSSISCDDIIVTLEKNACYISHYPSTEKRYTNIKVIEKSLGRIEKIHQEEIRNYLMLPVIPPTLLEACKVIQVSYDLKFEILTTGCHRNIEIVIPITIGTIPVIDEVREAVVPTAPVLLNRSDSRYSMISPPTYEEAIRMGDRFVDEEEERHSIHKSYMPKYPVYYNCKTPSP